MKTLILLSLAVTFLNFVYLEPTLYASGVQIPGEEKREKIRVSQLPSAVIDAWRKNPNALNARVKEVYKVTRDNRVCYEIKYRNGNGNEKTEKYNADGTLK